MSSDVDKLSCYILTYNSEKYLARILDALRNVVDDLLLVDSGSTDGTEQIAGKFGARLVHRPLDDFTTQRNFALDQCRHRWVLSLDSDELPDEELIRGILALKGHAFRQGGEELDAFFIKRRWFVAEREVHAFYPVATPDRRVMLFRKDRVNYKQDSKLVHETLSGWTTAGELEGSILHYSCDSLDRLDAKLDLYTSLAARDLVDRGKRAGLVASAVHSSAAWVKWYLRKGGWKDGRVGVALGAYAFRYTWLKYRKLRGMQDEGARDS